MKKSPLRWTLAIIAAVVIGLTVQGFVGEGQPNPATSSLVGYVLGGLAAGWLGGASRLREWVFAFASVVALGLFMTLFYLTFIIGY